MNAIKELININNNQKRICESLLPPESESPLRKLYELASQKNLSDHEAMIEIYGKRNIAAYSRLKSRLIDLLSKVTILQNNLGEAADTRIFEVLTSYRQTLLARILINKKSTELGIEIAEKALSKAMKYHATENVLILSRSLVVYFSQSGFNKYKLDKYTRIQEQYLRIYASEVRAENYVRILQAMQQKSLANASQQDLQRAKFFMDDLSAIKDIRSYHFNYNRFKVSAIYYEFIKDYNSLLELLNNVEIEFSNPDFKAGFAFNTIALRKCWALIQGGRNKEAAKTGLNQLKKMQVGSNGWYFMCHYIIKAQIYDGDYVSASKLITEMVNHPKFDRLGENYKELFYTTLGYIHLIVDSGLGDGIDKSQLPDFKIYKFLNTTQVFNKDKRGIQVTIILLHIAYLLFRKDYNSIIDQIDSLNQYAYRYLRKDDTFRSNVLIKMVIQMARADFNIIRTERYTEGLFKQLSTVELAGSGENIESEIIPYEILWAIMLRALR